MPIVKIPVFLPEWLYQPLRRLRNSLRNGEGRGLNLWGDRDVEFSFIAGHMPDGPGEALDFGCGQGYLSLIAARRGYRVLALDLQAQEFSWRDSAVRFAQGDLLNANLPKNRFDLILNCSTVEHVGLAGRYGVEAPQPDGDLQAMACLRTLLKPGGVMLMTVPCGRDAVFTPLHRVYGAGRLPQLLAGYSIESESFWVKDTNNYWIPCGREDATHFEASAEGRDPARCIYALGCFVLRHPRAS